MVQNDPQVPIRAGLPVPGGLQHLDAMTIQSHFQSCQRLYNYTGYSECFRWEDQAKEQEEDQEQVKDQAKEQEEDQEQVDLKEEVF